MRWFRKKIDRKVKERPLKDHLVVIEIENTHRAEVLKEIANKLYRARKIRDPQKLLALLCRRKILGSGGVGHGLAVPGERYEETDYNWLVVVGLSYKGLDLESLDGTSTYLFWTTIGYKGGLRDGFLPLLSPFIHLTRKTNFLRELKSGKNFAEIFTLLMRQLRDNPEIQGFYRRLVEEAERFPHP